ncbi:hypothetical protein ACILE9_07245 [Capnocytophaga cynodegmi]|uniref:hypothetical protein n=1 Tax=Capnocytophaga cynodegmi TaxID=28189 RepID=UPI0037D8B5F5
MFINVVLAVLFALVVVPMLGSFSVSAVVGVAISVVVFHAVVEYFTPTIFKGIVQAVVKPIARFSPTPRLATIGQKRFAFG